MLSTHSSTSPTVPSSLSWRIPLFIQIIPGIILALGSLILPHSPRLSVLKGRYDEARDSLARLRLRTLDEAQTDPIIQIELMEMRVECELVQRTFTDVMDLDSGKDGWKNEVKIWKRLFEYRYRDRTSVGVLMMVFQRESMRSSKTTYSCSSSEWSGINSLLYYG